MDIYIDGYIGKADFFSDGFSLKSLREQIGTSEEDLTIHINSGGGDVTEGFAIYDFLMALPQKVNTVGEGMVGSIATVIFQAGKKGSRKVHANTEFFIHNPYWTPQSPEPMEAKDAQRLAEDLKKAEDKILNFYVQNTNGKSKDDIKEKMNAQTSFSSSEAVDWGFVDEIIGTPVTNQKHYAVMAFVNNSLTKTNTMDIKKELDSFEGNLLKKIQNLFKKQFKNGMLQSGDVTLFFEGDMVTVGAPVFTDEAMTVVAPDGEYPTDANTIVVVGGVVSEIVEPSADANAALNAEIAELKAKLAEKELALNNSTTEKETLTAQVAEAKTAVEEIQTEFQNFKAQFVTGEGNIKPEFQNFKGNEPKPNLITQTLELRKNKKK